MSIEKKSKNLSRSFQMKMANFSNNSNNLGSLQLMFNLDERIYKGKLVSVTPSLPITETFKDITFTVVTTNTTYPPSPSPYITPVEAMEAISKPYPTGLFLINLVGVKPKFYGPNTEFKFYNYITKSDETIKVNSNQFILSRRQENKFQMLAYFNIIN